MTDQAIDHPHYETVVRTIDQHYQDLLRRHGAAYIGVAKKTIKGERQPATSVTFYVMEKGDDVAAERIPPYLDLVYADGRADGRVATDVVEIGQTPRALAVQGGHVIWSSDGEAGTVGLVLWVDGRGMLLTNAHVATDPGLPAGQVRVWEPGQTVPRTGFVRVIDDLSGPLIRSDAALIELPAGSVAPGRFQGVDLALIGYDEIRFNDPRRFYYVAENLLHELQWKGRVTAPAPIQIDGQLKLCKDFDQLQSLVGVVRPGHSGAVVFCRSNAGLIAVGLLFGGVPAINEPWVFPIRRCLQQMGIAT